MEEDTTLLVFGDHGMTVGGNHGGGSENELASVLFAYRKGNEGFQGHGARSEHLR